MRDFVLKKDGFSHSVASLAISTKDNDFVGKCTKGKEMGRCSQTVSVTIATELPAAETDDAPR